MRQIQLLIGPFLAAVLLIDGADAPRAASGIRFESPVNTGVRFVLQNASTPEKPLIDSVLGGVALLDYDQDGFLDIYFTNGASIPPLVKNEPRFWNRLYRNNHDGTFTDVTEKAGVAGVGYSMGVAAADYDNDGYPDLYVAGVNSNNLYRNLGNGTFGDATRSARVDGKRPDGTKPWSVGAAWFDYDNDGKLDLFVSNYLDWSPARAPVCGRPEKRLSCSPALFRGLPNILYHNNGDGTFTDVSAPMGIAEHVGKGMGLAVADYDDDGWLDVFVANDNERSFLFHNLKGRHFEEVGVAAGVAYTEDGVPASMMGTDFRDFNGDGLPDLIATALNEETFPFRLNAGNGTFEDATYKSGLGLISALFSGWSVGGYDFDNDGDRDLFTANSHVSENVAVYTHHRYKQINTVFENSGKGSFVDATKRAGAALQTARAHRGAAFGDLNNDGQVDAVVSAIGEPAVILMNAGKPAKHWIVIEARGQQSNRDGIGARIKVTAPSGRTQYNHVTTSVGYVSSSDRRVHFGLGNDAFVKQLELKWPSGKVQVLNDVKADQILKVNEP